MSPTGLVTRDGGRYGAAHRAPPTDSDPARRPPADFDVLAHAADARGFRPFSLSQPVPYVDGARDPICSIAVNHRGDPMRAACADLAVTSVSAGHWLPLERNAQHIPSIRTWLQGKHP